MFARQHSLYYACKCGRPARSHVCSPGLCNDKCGRPGEEGVTHSNTPFIRVNHYLPRRSWSPSGMLRGLLFVVAILPEIGHTFITSQQLFHSAIICLDLYFLLLSCVYVKTYLLSPYINTDVFVLVLTFHSGQHCAMVIVGV